MIYGAPLAGDRSRRLDLIDSWPTLLGINQSGWPERKETNRSRRRHQRAAWTTTSPPREAGLSGGDREPTGSGASISERAGQDNDQSREAETVRLKCRVEKDLYLDFEEYRHFTCAFCYK